MKPKAKRRRPIPPHARRARQLHAIEQPLRAHNLEMQVIATRNKKLDALKAAGLLNELQRVEQLLYETRASPHASIVATASKLKKRASYISDQIKHYIKMRKKPTFEELANATLRESTVSPLRLPYYPYNSSSQALVDLQTMTQQLQAQQQRGENVQAATIQEARDLNVDPQVLEGMAQGIMTSNSQMFQQFQAQQQHAAAADRRLSELRHEDITRQIAQTQQGIARNTDMQAQVAFNIQGVSDRIAQAVRDGIAQMPRVIPDDILQLWRTRLGNQPTLEQFQQAFERLAGEQRQLSQYSMQSLMTQQQQGQQALMDAQDRSMQQTLNQFQQLQAATTTTLVSQDQSQELARQLISRLLENLTQMFGQAAQGHHEMNRALLRQIAMALQQYPNVTIQNIDARQIIPQLLTLVDARRVDVALPAIQTVMNTLNMPNVTPEALQNVARQLAISHMPNQTPVPEPQAKARPLPDTPLPGPAIPMGDAPPLLPPPPPPPPPAILDADQQRRLKERTSIKEQSKGGANTQLQQVAKAASVAQAAARIATARQEPLQAASSSNVEVTSGPSTSVVVGHRKVGPLDVHSRLEHDRTAARAQYGQPSASSTAAPPPPSLPDVVREQADKQKRDFAQEYSQARHPTETHKHKRRKDGTSRERRRAD